MTDVAGLIELASRLAGDGVALDAGALDAGGAQLSERAGGDRDALTAARDHFLKRLHDRSDDYDATKALRFVHKAIEATPRTGIFVAEGRRRVRRT